MQQLLYTDALQTKFDEVARQSQILTGDDLQLAIRDVQARLGTRKRRYYVDALLGMKLII